MALLDDFNRANANPPSSSYTAITFLSNLAVVSNQLKANAAGNCGNYLNTITPGPAVESRIDIVTKGASGDLFFLLVRGQDVGSGATLDGYSVEVVIAAGTDSVLLRRVTNGAATTLATFSQEITNGDGIGIVVVGDTLDAQYRSGASGAWTSLGTATDTTYTGAGRLVIAIVNTTFVLDNWIGGTIVPGLMLLGVGG